jgi:hypothetical protein
MFLAVKWASTQLVIAESLFRLPPPPGAPPPVPEEMK